MVQSATPSIVRDARQLGAVLRRARRQAGLTQAALGEHIRMRQGTVSRLEAGEPAVQLQTVLAALAALGLELVVRPRSTTDAVGIEHMF